MSLQVRAVPVILNQGLSLPFFRVLDRPVAPMTFQCS